MNNPWIIESETKFGWYGEPRQYGLHVDGKCERCGARVVLSCEPPIKNER